MGRTVNWIDWARKSSQTSRIGMVSSTLGKGIAIEGWHFLCLNPQRVSGSIRNGFNKAGGIGA